jgi:hypothetical protein
MNESRPTPPPGAAAPRPTVTPAHLDARITGVVPVAKTDEVDLEPISLVDDAPTAPTQVPLASKIKFGAGVNFAGNNQSFKRKPFTTGQGAVRVRSFHGRLSDEGLCFMDDKINEWLDQHPEIEVKFVTTNIGQFEGKIREPALVVNVWF